MEQTLHLTRDSLSRPWGFRLQGGSETGAPLQVQRVFSGSPAEGLLQRGDVVLSIDGRDCRRITHRESLDIIRVSGGTLRLVISRDGTGSTFSRGHDEILRPTAVAPRRTQLRPHSQIAAYAAPPSPQPQRLTQSVYNEVEDSSLQNIESDPDYEFIHKSVSERRQLFSAPPQQGSGPMKPRGRIQSYRPVSDFHSLGTPNPAFGKRPEFGWCPSEEKMRAARMNTLSSTSVGQISPQKSTFASSNTARGTSGGYTASTLPNKFSGARSDIASRPSHQHTSSLVLQNNHSNDRHFSQQHQPTYSQATNTYRPAPHQHSHQNSDQLSSHLATLPRAARSYSTSHAPPMNWSQPSSGGGHHMASPGYNQSHGTNEVFGEHGPFGSRAKPLKINLYDSEPQQYPSYQGRQEVHPAYPLNSPHARTSGQQLSPTTRFVGALDGSVYNRQQDGNLMPARPVVSSIVHKSPADAGSMPTVHCIRKATPSSSSAPRVASTWISPPSAFTPARSVSKAVPVGNSFDGSDF